MGGGGGGSGYINTGGVIAGVSLNGNGQTPAQAWDLDRGGAGQGGNEDESGTSGRVIVYY
jgi:hypothetical protein